MAEFRPDISRPAGRDQPGRTSRTGPAPRLDGGTRLTGPVTIAGRWPTGPVIPRGRGHWPPPSSTSGRPGPFNTGNVC